jgi:ABC-type transporter Mla MlaB component
MSDFSVVVVEDFPQRVFITGNVGAATAARITQVLCDLSGDISVDCTGITLIDTAGFAALDWSYRVATLRGNTFEITGLRRLHPAARPHVDELVLVPSLCSGRPGW